MKESTALRINKATTKAPSGVQKAQMLFNQLIRNIENKRANLKKWQDAVHAVHQAHEKDFLPALRQYDEARAAAVRRLDQVFDEKTFTKKERSLMRDLITDMAAELFSMNGDPALKEIFNRHSRTEYDALILARQKELRETIEKNLKVKLDEDLDFSSMESVMTHVEMKMEEKFEGMRQEPEPDVAGKASARAKAAKAREEKKAQEVSQSIREVYRKLASALHPDKEIDPAERERKTGMMKRVNVAYDNGDLLALLTLQMEIEQIDQRTIDTLPIQRLRHYNQILREQSAELEQEIDAVQMAFKSQFDINPYAQLTPRELMPIFRSLLKDIRTDLRRIQGDLAAFNDLRNIKSWLKSYRPPPSPFMDDDLFF